MFKQLKIFLLTSLIILALASLVLIAVVERWRYTDAGKVPVKTAVLLHAVNQRLVTADMKPPKFLTRKGTSTFKRENLEITMSDGAKIPIRMYEPLVGGPHPIIIYYHGGAFMKGYGDINTHDNIVRALATKTKSVVISVGYRVAPDHPFPTATEDSYEALLWAVENANTFNGDPNRIAVAGDSAGGNLATVVALMARDRNGPTLTAQALFYPLTTFKDVDFSSRDRYDSGYFLLSRNVMLKARNQYTPNEEMWSHPYTSPLDAENLKQLPPSLIITAEFDPLRDEGEAYGERLKKHHVPVKMIRYKGVMHGFVSFYEVLYSGNHALQETANYLNRAFHNDLEPNMTTFEIYDKPSLTEVLREKGEAYAIAGFLIGRKAYSKLQTWQNIGQKDDSTLER